MYLTSYFHIHAFFQIYIQSYLQLFISLAQRLNRCIKIDLSDEHKGKVRKIRMHLKSKVGHTRYVSDAIFITMTTSTTSVSSAFLTALKNKDHNKV